MTNIRKFHTKHPAVTFNTEREFKEYMKKESLKVFLGGFFSGLGLVLLTLWMN